MNTKKATTAKAVRTSGRPSQTAPSVAAVPTPSPLTDFITLKLLRDLEQLGGTIEALRYVLEKAGDDEDGRELIDWNALAGLCRGAFEPYEECHTLARKLHALVDGAR